MMSVSVSRCVWVSQWEMFVTHTYCLGWALCASSSYQQQHDDLKQQPPLASDKRERMNMSLRNIVHHFPTNFKFMHEKCTILVLKSHMISNYTKWKRFILKCILNKYSNWYWVQSDISSHELSLILCCCWGQMLFLTPTHWARPL